MSSVCLHLDFRALLDCVHIELLVRACDRRMVEAVLIVCPFVLENCLKDTANDNARMLTRVSGISA